MIHRGTADRSEGGERDGFNLGELALENQHFRVQRRLSWTAVTVSGLVSFESGGDGGRGWMNTGSEKSTLGLLFQDVRNYFG